MLSTRSATALYVGAVLGPGLLIVPALAAEAAGPASLVAWAALLVLSAPLAATFATLGVRFPEAGGTAAYVRAAFGRRPGAVTGWWFLVGVVLGAPAVALAGGYYVAELLGTGRDGAVVAAAGMMGIVAVANSIGLHVTARLQLGLAGLLAALLLVAVVTALPESRAENWTPFAPHGWGAVGTAASLLMLSFIGWEAVSHLAGELRDPARQLPRAIFFALAVVIVLYLGLAVATVGVLGTESPSNVPLADLMGAGLGEAGRTGTAALATLLTMGTMNAYVAAAVKLSGALAAEGSAPA
jgi:amino acid efflux transporter